MRIDFDRLSAAGMLMCDDHGTEAKPVNIAWELTREAARTLSSLPGLPRRGYPGKSAWPEFLDDDYFAMLRQRLTDGVEGEATRIRIVPTAAAIDRSEAMWWLWREFAFPKLGKRRELLRIVWLYAGGLRPAKIGTLFGVSRSRLHRAKIQGCEGVSKKMLGNKCNEIYVHSLQAASSLASYRESASS